jgi:shikimate dehydrogenase
MTGEAEMSDYLSGRAALAGVIGWPISHSLSPRLHGFWLRQHRIDGAYVPLAVAPEKLEQALRALPALGFRGVNLTIPHKEPALAVVDRITPAAARIGAVNTVIVEACGLLGDNTDGYGFMANLGAGAPAWQAGARPAVLLGAGGAARAIAVALIEAGAPELRLVNRTRVRAETLAGQLAEMAQEHGTALRVLPWQDPDALSGASLLVNTTSLGMTGQPPLEVDLARLPGDALVTDIVYNPLETGLLAAARARGHAVVDGLGMLLHQARPGFRAWFGVDPEVSDALRATVLAGLG